MNKPKLIDYTKNVYSQFGEDGIIEKIFSVIGERTKVCIEFGAWDGVYLSNTTNLWKNGWKAILIESDVERFRTLSENVKGFNCITLNYCIGNDPDNDSLEYVLHKNEVKDEIDLLSIDVDGNDYYIFQSLNRIRPRVIICEFNPTIPYHLDVYADYRNYFGCSISALNRVAGEKGYRLVAVTDVNCFYVRDEEYDLFLDFETDLKEIVQQKGLNYIVTSYSGEYTVIGEFWYGLGQQLDQHINIQPGVTIKKKIIIGNEE
jgi:hypothetical protein